MIKLTIYIKHCGDCLYLKTMRYSTGYPEEEYFCEKGNSELSFTDVPDSCPINTRQNEIY